MRPVALHIVMCNHPLQQCNACLRLVGYTTSGQGECARIANRYAGSRDRLYRISASKIHTILTNEAYIGVRTINRRSKAEREEVSAA